MSQFGGHLFVLSYTRQAIICENRQIFGRRQRYLPLITGTVLLVRIMPFGGHRWIDVSRTNIHLN